MGGTSLSPQAYTGRAGIPDFKELGRLTIFRVSGSRESNVEKERMSMTREAGLECYRRLSHGRYASPVNAAAERSEMTPIWLMAPDASACGMLEDTRKAKRLISDDGSEMLSAHLSCFAYRDAVAGGRLIGAALSHTSHLGFPALFVSVPEKHTQEIQAALSQFAVHLAPATVYGTGLEPGCWNINTSEI